MINLSLYLQFTTFFLKSQHYFTVCLRNKEQRKDKEPEAKQSGHAHSEISSGSFCRTGVMSPILQTAVALTLDGVLKRCREGQHIRIKTFSNDATLKYSLIVSKIYR